MSLAVFNSMGNRKEPFVPLVPLLGIAMCLALMAKLPALTWERFVIWLAAGMVIYFAYGRRKSRLARV